MTKTSFVPKMEIGVRELFAQRASRLGYRIVESRARFPDYVLEQDGRRLFAEAKTLHGLRRFRLRSLEKVNMEGLKVAAGQNLKPLLRHLGTRPAPRPLALLATLLFPLRRLLLRPVVPDHNPYIAFAR